MVQQPNVNRKCVLWLLLLQQCGSLSATPPIVHRSRENPVLSVEMHSSSLGNNINGPSVLRVPSWAPGKHLGKYYLYCGHHDGESIRLAYSDNIEGPFTVHGAVLSRDEHLQELQLSHIASPDVLIDDDNEQFIMVLHLGGFEKMDASTRWDLVRGCWTPQVSISATSKNGIDWENVGRTCIGRPYLRSFRPADSPWWYGVVWGDKGLRIYRTPHKRDWVSAVTPAPRTIHDSDLGPNQRPYDAGPELWLPDGESGAFTETCSGPRIRHTAVHYVPATGVLSVYYSTIGHTPERIHRSTIRLADKTESDWNANRWTMTPSEEVIRPVESYEGAHLPAGRSSCGASKQPVNQLRDPYIYAEPDGTTYLFYSVAGEQGIAVARIEETNAEHGSDDRGGTSPTPPSSPPHVPSVLAPGQAAGPGPKPTSGAPPVIVHGNSDSGNNDAGFVVLQGCCRGAETTFKSLEHVGNVGDPSAKKYTDACKSECASTNECVGIEVHAGWCRLKHGAITHGSGDNSCFCIRKVEAADAVTAANLLKTSTAATTAVVTATAPAPPAPTPAPAAPAPTPEPTPAPTPPPTPAPPTPTPAPPAPTVVPTLAPAPPAPAPTPAPATPVPTSPEPPVGRKVITFKGLNEGDVGCCRFEGGGSGDKSTYTARADVKTAEACEQLCRADTSCKGFEQSIWEGCELHTIKPTFATVTAGCKCKAKVVTWAIATPRPTLAPTTPAPTPATTTAPTPAPTTVPTTTVPTSLPTPAPTPTLATTLKAGDLVIVVDTGETAVVVGVLEDGVTCKVDYQDGTMSSENLLCKLLTKQAQTTSTPAPTPAPTTPAPTQLPTQPTQEPTSVPTSAPTPEPAQSCEAITKKRLCNKLTDTALGCKWNGKAKGCIKKDLPTCEAITKKGACNKLTDTALGCKWYGKVKGCTKETCGAVTRSKKCKDSSLGCKWNRKESVCFLPAATTRLRKNHRHKTPL